MPDCYEVLHACLDAAVDDGSLDADGDSLTNLQEYLIGTDPCVPDTDGDGCSDFQEESIAFDPLDPWDFYDVPVPALADPSPNGTRNKVVDIGDVLAVLFYAFADEGGPPNANGVDYDSDKGIDTDGDTMTDVPPDGVPDGRDYDRSPGLDADPVTGIDPAGPPNSVIDIGDVLVVLAQAFVVDCSAGP